jgi:hypothetical protein
LTAGKTALKWQAVVKTAYYRMIVRPKGWKTTIMSNKKTADPSKWDEECKANG